MLCSTCKISLLDKSRRVFNCQTCECYLCKDCKTTHDSDHDIIKEKSRKVKEEQEDTTNHKSEYLDGMLEDYYNLGFEDIIGKEIYTRFKYAKVRDSDFGLSNEDILLLNDNELNKLVSLKKYKPYRHDEDRVNLHRVKTIKQEYRSKIEDGKKQLKKVLKQDIKLQKEKLLGIKTDAREQIRQMRREEKAQEKKDKYENIEKEIEVEASGKRSRRDLYNL
mmetsp:Transcript_29165/g.25798  ORF Transcript_29165/g.25798 Transcript_29165/m.25798 type:complete len:221 (-) Transcript_29165:32-694(-)